MRDWISFKRLVPLGTALFALGAEVAHVFGLAPTLDVEAVVLFVLALLALDALVERVGIVERIERHLSRLETPSVLRDRAELVKIDELAFGADELAACGATLFSLVPQQHDFLLKKLNAGMSMRFVVLDSKSPAWQIWNDVEIPTPTDLDTTLKTFASLMNKHTAGNIEVRVAPFMLPSSLVIANTSQTTGRMNVEFAFNGVATLPHRPHIYIARSSSPQWFEFFCDRFEKLWERSKPYTP
jgi:hypothetical protein